MSEESSPTGSNMQDMDQEALLTFIEEKRPQLLAYIRKSLNPRLQQKVDPEDILQEMSIQALGMLESGAGTGPNPFSWLCQIAEQRIIDAHRKFIGAQKRNLHREVPLGSPGSDNSDSPDLIDLLVQSLTTPSQALSRNQRHQRLEEALKELPEIAREALRLRYVENMATKDIAAQLGKTDGSIRVLLTRSLRRLEQILSEETG